MSSNGNKTKKGRAQAVAAWEWFKEAAWLQVLLIVGVVVGLVVAIPFVVKAITNAINNNDSDFFDSHRISYAQLEKYIEGKDKNCNGYFGEHGNNKFTDDGKFDFNSYDYEGFTVIFYASDCDNCDTFQSPLETWFNNFNKNYGEGHLKLYTVDVSWDTSDDEDAANNRGNQKLYNNKYISLEEQRDYTRSLYQVYKNQDPVHQSSSVDPETLKDYETEGDLDAKTMNTPTIVSYSKKTSDTSYITDLEGYNSDSTKENIMQYTTPSMVLFGNPTGLSLSNSTDVATMMQDLYGFKDYKGSN